MYELKQRKIKLQILIYAIDSTYYFVLFIVVLG